MQARFGTFVLDDVARIFRSQAREITLQPRLFDLLAYLVRNRDRVVSKIDLVDSVWAGAFVTDSAVQRAISMLRAILREGGAGDAIRTYPRQGYRFCPDVVFGDDQEASVNAPLPAAGDGEPAGSQDAGDLERAREAFTRAEWATAEELFRKADEGPGLGGSDLARWGEALEFLGRLGEAILPLERAIAALTAAGARRDAARSAMRLANLQLQRREIALAGGWLRRAERCLAESGPVHEKAMLLWLKARVALFTGDLEGALTLSDEAYELACAVGDREVEVLALMYRGHAHVALGRVHPGVGFLDEAAAAVTAENLSPWAGGIVYCGVIWSSLNRGDWRRAAAWSGQFTRWCEVQRVRGYWGLCSLHRAEVMMLQGNAADAEEAVQEAIPQLAEAAPDSEGDGYRVLGDIRLGRGDLDGAEEAYRRAHELGWDPNPGYALLQAARGRVHAGLRALEGALRANEWSVRQRRAFVLAHLVMLAANAGELTRAREALAELDANPDLASTPAAKAVVAQARGELAFAAGDGQTAVTQFRLAVQAWRDVGSPCRMASVRLRLASALASAGDREGADLELTAAETVFSQRGLDRLREGCAELRRQLDARP